MVKIAKVAPPSCKGACPPSTKEPEGSCIEILTDPCIDLHLTQGETWQYLFAMLETEPVALKGVNPGSNGSGSFVLSGNVTCIEPGDKIHIFGDCNPVGCDNLEGCYHVTDVINDCGRVSETFIYVEEQIVTDDCCNPLMFGLQSLAPGCNVYTQPPMLGKINDDCSLTFSGKITNRVNKHSMSACKVQTYLGSNEVLFHPGGHAECYDVLTVPQAGIIQAQIRNVVREGNYDRIYLDDGVVANISADCLAGHLSDGIITHFQFKQIDCGVLVYIEPDSKTVDMGTPLNPDPKYFRGTRDIFLCNESCEDIDPCDHNHLGYYSIAVQWVDCNDIHHSRIIASGSAYLKLSTLAFH